MLVQYFCKSEFFVQFCIGIGFGVAVVNTVNVGGFKNNIGIDRDLDTPEAYVEAIEEIANLPVEEYQAMCERAKEAAKQFDYDVLSEKLIQIIETNV